MMHVFMMSFMMHFLNDVIEACLHDVMMHVLNDVIDAGPHDVMMHVLNDVMMHVFMMRVFMM